jgi:hypothetical protein
MVQGLWHQNDVGRRNRRAKPVAEEAFEEEESTKQVSGKKDSCSRDDRKITGLVTFQLQDGKTKEL